MKSTKFILGRKMIQSKRILYSYLAFLSTFSYFILLSSSFLFAPHDRHHQYRHGKTHFLGQTSISSKTINKKFYQTRYQQGTPRKVILKPIGASTDNEYKRDDIRNIAIIAHVDHGKTTLVDAMLKQSNAFRSGSDNENAVRVMDNDAQERERGITILAKNTAITYNGVKINIVDTPGHADFGGEVERVLNMVDSVLLVVDAVEGPKPQTKFVLTKAIQLGLKCLLVVNKCDRPEARAEVVVDKVFDLFSDVGATDEQMDYDTIYSSAIKGIAGISAEEMGDNIIPLFDKILDLPKPLVNKKGKLQLLIANIQYDNYKGRMGIGRIFSGTLKKGVSIGVARPDTPVHTGEKVSEIFEFENLGKKSTEEASAGDIVMFTGIEKISIGDTLVDPSDPLPMTPISVGEPTVKMLFGVNKSPFAGREGQHVTSRSIYDRLCRELDKNLALRMSKTQEPDTFEIKGRGQMHLTVLIENLRREGFEIQVGPPEVIEKVIDGKKCEPYEHVDISIPEEYVGSTVELIGRRKGDLLEMGSTKSDGTVTISYLLATRSMFGLRSVLLTATRGTAILDSYFYGYKPLLQGFATRDKGSLLAHQDGISTSHGLLNAQDRGQPFINPRVDVYKNMIVGIHQRPGDLAINVCKLKSVSNVRKANKEITVGLMVPIELTLDLAVEYIQADELVEVTPKNIRMYKNPAMVGGKRKKR